MRNHQDADTLVVQALEQLHDLFAGMGVERSGRLIGQQNFRMVDDRSCNRHSLFLAAGKLGWFETHTVAEPHPLEGNRRPLSSLFFRHARIRQRQAYIFHCALSCKELEVLEDKADFLQADVRHLIVTAFADVLSVEDQPSARRLVEAADNIHQCCFSGTGRTHDRNVLAFFHGEVDVFQNRNRDFALHIFFTDIL